MFLLYVIKDLDRSELMLSPFPVRKQLLQTASQILIKLFSDVPCVVPLEIDQRRYEFHEFFYLVNQK